MMAVRRAESFNSIHVPIEDIADAEAARPRFSTIVTDASDESSVLIDGGNALAAGREPAPSGPSTFAGSPAGRTSALPHPALSPATLSPATLSPPSRPHDHHRASLEDDADLDGDIELEVAAASAKMKAAAASAKLQAAASGSASAPGEPVSSPIRNPPRGPLQLATQIRPGGNDERRSSLGFPVSASAHLRAQHSSSPAYSRFLSDFQVGGERVAVSTAVPAPNQAPVRRYFSGNEHFEI